MRLITKLFLFFLFIAVIFITTNTAMAQQEFTTVADVYVRGGANADANYGSDVELRVRATATSEDNKRKTYIKFDLTSYSSTLGKAILQFTVDRAVGTPRDRVDFYDIFDDNWDEATITWNNAPLPGTLLFSSDFQHQASADPDSTYSFDVTSYVAQELNADKMITFYMYDDSLIGTDLRIYSKESTGTPAKLILSEATAVEDNGLTIPGTFAVKQNYPNPFNPSTEITYSLPSAGEVSIGIYNVLGQKVRSLLNATESQGTRQISWNGKDDSNATVPSGIYFARVNFQNQSKLIKMILNR